METETEVRVQEYRTEYSNAESVKSTLHPQALHFTQFIRVVRTRINLGGYWTGSRRGIICSLHYPIDDDNVICFQRGLDAMFMIHQCMYHLISAS